MIGFVCDTPLTVYANVPALPFANVSVALPTSVRVTFEGSNGIALNGGPLVRYSGPSYTPAARLSACAKSHSGVRSKSYVNHVAKITSPWCVKLIPQPDSEPPGAAHQISW